MSCPHGNALYGPSCPKNLLVCLWQEQNGCVGPGTLFGREGEIEGLGPPDHHRLIHLLSLLHPGNLHTWPASSWKYNCTLDSLRFLCYLGSVAWDPSLLCGPASFSATFWLEHKLESTNMFEGSILSSEHEKATAHKPVPRLPGGRRATCLSRHFPLTC